MAPPQAVTRGGPSPPATPLPSTPLGKGKERGGERERERERERMVKGASEKNDMKYNGCGKVR